MSGKNYVGASVSRLEGREKVTGTAKYAADYDVPDLLHGYVINSTVTKGEIKAIDASVALQMPGVVDVITHTNRPRLAWFDIQYTDMDAPPGEVFKPLVDEKIRYHMQPVALVVAKDFETARYASSLVKIVYHQDDHQTSLAENIDYARKPKKGFATVLKPPPPDPTGNFQEEFAKAKFKVSTQYTHGAEHHNPIELFATTTVYEGNGKITVYDKTQGTINNQVFIANVFGLKFKNVKVLAPFVGGAFGSGLRTQYHVFLCVMAALHLKKNVRVVLDRKQMFSFGHRPQALQKLQFCADSEGRVTGMNHESITETSGFEDYTELITDWSHKLYPSQSTLFKSQVVPLDLHTPIDMRAPGGVTGMHAIECTMDELAYKLDMDPLQLRLINYSAQDPSTGKPYTSKSLKECYLQAAEKFGWSDRSAKPGSMTRGNRFVGYGMSTGMWDAYQFPSRIEMIIRPDGKLLINNATTDIGTGTLTVMTQIAADELGLAIEDVIFSYGDSSKPFSMFQGGSAITSSTGAAIVIAAKELKKTILKKAAQTDNSVFKNVSIEEVEFVSGSIILRSDPSQKISFIDVIAGNKGREIKIKKMGMPHALKLRKYSKGTHSACFAEVEIDKELKTITVTKLVTAVAAGKIINPKTARSQVLGSMIWGISKTLHEESLLDPRFGKFVNTNLGEYHIPTHADINELEVIFAEEKDSLINELGVKGVGEIGLVAVPAAITNAIFHATGKRVYKLPIHFDDLF